MIEHSFKNIMIYFVLCFCIAYDITRRGYRGGGVMGAEAPSF